MRIGIAQINPTVGDIAGNAEIILETVKEGEKNKLDLVIFPELALTGYPPEDLLFKNSFIQDNLTALKELSHFIKKTVALIGFANRKKNAIYNSVAWIEKGKVQSIYDKQNLPNYGVFDEERYFSPGSQFLVKKINGIKIAITICEDIWNSTHLLKKLKRQNPDLVINISASPYHSEKINLRKKVAAQAARIIQRPVVYCNMQGGQDELVFDGGSFVTDKKGVPLKLCPQFKTGLFIFDFDSKDKTPSEFGWPDPKPLSKTAEIHEALLTGIKDYVYKNNFEKAAVAVSGGIDSALVLALAAEALGKDKVVAVTMPSRFNQNETVEDAILLAKNLGTKIIQIPIHNIYDLYLNSLKEEFKTLPLNKTEENLQARIRGNLIMALSNKFNWLVLATGNKSEMSTGYCTLYGDTVGGFAVLKDVIKTRVYELSNFINEKSGRDIIPRRTLNRPPSAELKENQKDEDSLGPYHDLDPLIVGYVEENKSFDELKKISRLKENYIRKIISLVDKSEYKRRQAPPGIKITPRSFGKDHRMPITNRYKPR